LIHLGGNQYNIRTFHGKYVSAEPNGKVICDRHHAKEWERFQIDYIPGHHQLFSVRSHHGRYLSAQPDGRVECNRHRVEQWESFLIQ
jgi:hypothetical protein